MTRRMFMRMSTYGLLGSIPVGRRGVFGANAVVVAQPPVITSVSPTYGPTGGATAVTILGSGFTGATQVQFGDSSHVATSVVVVDDTEITCVSPNNTGIATVMVTTPYGTPAQGSNAAFDYLVPGFLPSIGNVSPNRGSTAGGTPVTIGGFVGSSGFIGVTAVKFGTVDATSFTVVDERTITCVSPAGSAGTVDILVTNVNGTNPPFLTDRFTYVGPGAPVVAGITVDGGPASGGTAVQIAGQGFTGATAVHFGTTPATSVVVVNDHTVTCVSPAGVAVPTLTWTQLFPPSSPPVRTVHAMCLDATGDNILVVSGDQPPAHALRDFWSYSVATGFWSQLSGTPPTLRADFNMLLEPSADGGKIVGFGGTDYVKNFGDTWVYDGPNWSQLTPLASPSGRSEFACAYDPVTGHIFVHGGWPNASTTMDSDQYLWTGSINGAGATWQTSTPHSTVPRGRAGHAMAHDPSRGIVVMFGGHGGGKDGYGTVLGDTCIWSDASGEPDWKIVSGLGAGTTSPTARYYHEMYYDPNLQMVVLYGGTDNSAACYDAWAWNGTVWIQLEQTTTTSLSQGTKIVWVPSQDCAISFGGWIDFPGTITNQTWKLTSAPASAVTVDVTVTTPKGTSPVTPADEFTYAGTP